MTIVLLLLILILLFAGCRPSKNNNGYLSKTTGTGLRGFACLLVILAHTGSNCDQLHGPVTDMAGPAGVAVFFFLSGYGLTKSMSDGYVKGFLGRKLPKLWVPILILIPVYYIMYNFIFPGYSEEFTGITNVWKSLLEGNTLVLGGWYILVMTVFYMAFQFGYRLYMAGGKNNRVMFTFAAALIYFVYEAFVVLSFWPAHWIVTPHMFVIGMIWGLNEQKILKTGYVIPLTGAAGAVIIAAGVMMILSGSYYPYFIGLALAATGLTAVLIFLSRNLVLGNRFINFAGKYSFGIYLTHWLVLWSLEKLITNVYVWLIVSVPVIMVAGMFADKLFKAVDGALLNKIKA